MSGQKKAPQTLTLTTKSILMAPFTADDVRKDEGFPELQRLYGLQEGVNYPVWLWVLLTELHCCIESRAERRKAQHKSYSEDLAENQQFLHDLIAMQVKVFHCDQVSK